MPNISESTYLLLIFFSVTIPLRPAHLAVGARALSCGLLGLCSLSYRAFFLPYDPRHTWSLGLYPLLFVAIFLFYLLHLDPRSFYTIPWSADHG